MVRRERANVARMELLHKINRCIFSRNKENRLHYNICYTGQIPLSMSVSFFCFFFLFLNELIS